MPEPLNEYMDAPPGYSVAIQRAIEDWIHRQAVPLPFPIKDADLADLARLITKRLVQAGLIDADLGSRGEE